MDLDMELANWENEGGYPGYSEPTEDNEEEK